MIINIGSRVMNTFLYPIEDGYVMIDTGYHKSFRSCLRKMQSKNISISKIKYIFLTHAHDDHAGFINEMITENNDIKVIMSPKGIDVLRKGQNSFDGNCSGNLSYMFCLLLKFLGKGQHTFPAIKKDYEKNLLFITNENKNEIEHILKGTVLETEGHTNDSISLLTNDGDLFCGDAAMNGFPSKNNITIWIENKAEYKKSWQKFIDLKPKVIYPAHGKAFKSEVLEKNIKKIDGVKLYPLAP